MTYENNLYNSASKFSSKIYSNLEKSINTNLDKDVLDFGTSHMSYNFNCEQGVLKDGVGIRNLKFRYAKNSNSYYKTIDNPANGVYLTGCWHFRAWDSAVSQYDDYLIFYASNGKFYYNYLHSESVILTEMTGLEFEEKPSIVTSSRINGADTLILISSKDGMYTWRYPNIVTKINNAPKIKSLCVADGRLFATTYGDGRNIIFCDSLDPTYFNNYLHNGGEVNVSDGYFGKANKIVYFNSYIYIFRDFNIAKLSTYASKRDFGLTQLYVSNGLIAENTVSVCGDKILYLASDGIYSFDGNKSTRLELGITNLFKDMDNFYAVACYCNGYYYLSCNINYDDNILNDNLHTLSLKNNALIKINVATGNATILRGCNISDMTVIDDDIKSEVCVNVNIQGAQSLGLLEDSGKLYNNSTLKVWKSSIYDFGCPDKNKVVRELGIETSQNIDIEIIHDNKVKSFSMLGKNGYQTIRPYVRGKKLGIVIKSRTTNNRILKPKITVGYVK